MLFSSRVKDFTLNSGVWERAVTGRRKRRKYRGNRVDKVDKEAVVFVGFISGK